MPINKDISIRIPIEVRFSVILLENKKSNIHGLDHPDKRSIEKWLTPLVKYYG